MFFRFVCPCLEVLFAPDLVVRGLLVREHRLHRVLEAEEAEDPDPGAPDLQHHRLQGVGLHGDGLQDPDLHPAPRPRLLVVSKGVPLVGGEPPQQVHSPELERGVEAVLQRHRHVHLLPNHALQAGGGVFTDVRDSIDTLKYF